MKLRISEHRALRAAAAWAVANVATGDNRRRGLRPVVGVLQHLAVALWPSLYLDHRSFDDVVADLAAAHRCIVVDGPGHGRSPGPGRRYDLAACARAAMQVLDALHVDDVDWVGNAWGGHVGARAAIDFPRRVRALVAISAPMHPPSRKVRLRSTCCSP
jgi:pimeloyl-ACP methyl ester carboxylesterase